MLQCVRCGEIHPARPTPRGGVASGLAAGAPGEAPFCGAVDLPDGHTANRHTAEGHPAGDAKFFVSLQIAEIQLVMVKRPSGVCPTPRSGVAPLDCAPRPARARHRGAAWLPVPSGATNRAAWGRCGG